MMKPTTVVYCSITCAADGRCNCLWPILRRCCNDVLTFILADIADCKGTFEMKICRKSNTRKERESLLRVFPCRVQENCFVNVVFSLND